MAWEVHMHLGDLPNRVGEAHLGNHQEVPRGLGALGETWVFAMEAYWVLELGVGAWGS